MKKEYAKLNRAQLLEKIEQLESENTKLKSVLNNPLIGDGKHTISDWAKLHVDACYEPSSSFDRECMIKCVEVGYEAFRLSIVNNYELQSENQTPKAEQEWINVETELPPAGEYILVFMAGYISMVYYSKSHEHQKLSYYQEQRLTHWMKLPNKPTEIWKRKKY